MEVITTTNDYNIFMIEPNNQGFSFPYILCIPKKLGESNSLFVETNNEENSENLLNSAKYTVSNILKLMNGSKNKSPILVPILPTNGINGRPYFQQLSKECFDKKLSNDKQKIDEQLVHAIDDAKDKFLKITGKRLDDKIFMHGYSASGVFAQRFALAHPETVGELCVGGAIGSIPMPLKEYNGVKLEYPVGIDDYKELFGKEFNFDEYKKIKFRYYVAELEDKRLSETRFTEDGDFAPMHDMSYMDRSIPNEVGKNLRTVFGNNMFERCRNQLSTYKNMGFNVSAHAPYKGVMHNEIRNLAYKYIDDCLNEFVADRIKE